MDPFRDLNKKITETAESMTKREYFAALALQGIMASKPNAAVDIVGVAVDLADNLILKLKETHE